MHQNAFNPSVISKRLLLSILALLLLTPCVMVAKAATPSPADDVVVQESQQWMDIETNVSSSLSVEMRESRNENDANCRSPEDVRSIATGQALTTRVPFNFARQRSPGIALYEWHVCFVIDGQSYRAWHGFDPGPGALLHAHCFIDAQQFAAKDTTKDICPKVDVTLNLANYAEFAASAPTMLTPARCPDLHGPIPSEVFQKCYPSGGGSNLTEGYDIRNPPSYIPRITIRTNSASTVAVVIHWSHAPNDVDCNLWGDGGQTAKVDAATSAVRLSAFARQFAPGNARYEWNICFVIDNTLYRAWRGYDPGPHTGLNLDCFIDAKVLVAKDTTHYLCARPNVTPNLANYAEYGVFCLPDNANACRTFNTQDEYESWRGLGNPLSAGEQDQIAEAVLKYALTHSDTYLYANAKDFELYLLVGGKDPTPDFLARVATNGIGFKPGSTIPKEPNKGGIVLTGRNMQVFVSNFTVTEPDVAHGGLSGYCGALCAGSTAVTMHRRNGAWEVGSLGPTIVQ
jgi:hypothetical protein